MHLQNIQQIVKEIGPLIVGRYLGKVFQMGRASFAFDFGLRDGRYLFISVDPTAPRLYLIKRRIKDLEKQSVPHAQFAQVLSARLSGALLTDVTRDESERIVRFTLETQYESDDTYTLVVQLTGRSANLFLLGPDGRINVAGRTSKTVGQLAGDEYHLPPPQTARGVDEVVLPQGDFDSLSAALDSHYQKLETKRSFQAVVNSVRGSLKKEIEQRIKLRKNLEQDLANHGEPDQHKRLGDLLLANLSTAKRNGSKLVIQDFYAEGSPEIELEVDKDRSLQEEATHSFNRYTKAKRAREEIAKRLKQISSELEELSLKQAKTEKLIEHEDLEELVSLQKPVTSRRRGTKAQSKIPGVRTYRSSDGYEVLVGRAAKDNDYLTFRVAGPNDLWLHSADYPGSHVVVRRQNRKELPQRTIIEAAQLAAHFSQAGKDSRVVVHYTPRKFLSKPRGAAPGLVRMSNFKTILVEPKEILKRE